MIATNFSNVRNNFKEVCDRVVHDSDIAIITRKNDENVVLMSQAQYDNLMENLHIRESKANYEWLKESMKQAEDGKLVNFEVEDQFMNVSFTENAWEDYLYWQKMDKKIVKRINELIKDIKRNPLKGLGKPEPLKYDLAGKWSRRITDEHHYTKQSYRCSVMYGRNLLY